MDEKALYQNLAKAVASRQVPDNSIREVAKQLVSPKFRIRRLDICAYGICLDYFLDPGDLAEALQEVVRIGGARIGEIKIFPYGIPVPDLYHVQVEQDFDVIPRVLG